MGCEFTAHYFYLNLLSLRALLTTLMLLNAILFLLDWIRVFQLKYGRDCNNLHPVHDVHSCQWYTEYFHSFHSLS